MYGNNENLQKLCMPITRLKLFQSLSDICSSLAEILLCEKYFNHLFYNPDTVILKPTL